MLLIVQVDDYSGMFVYFDVVCIEGYVLVGVNGVIVVNQVVGDFNLQVNLCGIVIGEYVDVLIGN